MDAVAIASLDPEVCNVGINFRERNQSPKEKYPKVRFRVRFRVRVTHTPPSPILIGRRACCGPPAGPGPPAPSRRHRAAEGTGRSSKPTATGAFLVGRLPPDFAPFRMGPL